jgi:tetratricopeptide (TPR) repeat protein
VSGVDDLRIELENIAETPYGAAHSAAVETLVGPADAAGDPALARDVRFELVRSYSLGGEPLKQFLPFSWLLRLHSDDPGTFDEMSTWQLLWMFKWVTVGAMDHPGVSLVDIERGLNQMEELYRAAGEGLAPYLGCRFRVDALVQGHEQAEAAYQAWVRAPRTHLSDCEACEPSRRVEHLVAGSRHEEAVREALPVLVEGGCIEQPHWMIANILESLLLTGDPVRAAQEHLRGARLNRQRPGSTGLWASHILVLARSGRLLRGLDLLEDHLHEVDDAPTPYASMELAAAGARLLRGLGEAGLADLELVARGGRDRTPTGVGDLERRLTRIATDLAKRFDVRNGTPRVGEQVRRWLDAGELPDLPLDDVTSRRSPVPAARSASPVSSVALDPDAGRGGSSSDPEDLLAAFEVSRATGSHDQRTAVLDAWRRRPRGEADEAIEVRLDAAALVDDIDAGNASALDLSAVTTRLRQAGFRWLAITYDLYALRHRVESGQAPSEPGAELDRLIAEGQEYCSPSERGCLNLLKIGLRSLIAGSGGGESDLEEPDFQAGIDLLQADPGDLDPFERGSLALQMMLRARSEPVDDRIAQLRVAYELLPAGTRAHERAAIGVELAGVLAETGDLASVTALLPDVVEDARICGEGSIEAQAWGMLGRVHEHIGDAAAAVTAFGRAVRVVQTDRPVQLASAQQELVYALRAVGRGVEAAELAETALQTLLEGTGLADPSPVNPGSAEPSLADPSLADPEGSEADPVAARTAATLAYVAALTASDLDEEIHANGLARRSAGWHRSIGWGAAEAEALSLAARTESEPAAAIPLMRRAVSLFKADGLWAEAALGRRWLSGPVFDAEGLDAARVVLAEARAALDEVDVPERAERELAVQHLLLTERTVRVLAAGDEYKEALAAGEGLDVAYRDLGFDQAARNIVALRADILDDLGRTEEGLDALETAAQESLDAGDELQARQLGGLLARLLDGLGRPDDAEAAWQRFAG